MYPIQPNIKCTKMITKMKIEGGGSKFCAELVNLGGKMFLHTDLTFLVKHEQLTLPTRDLGTTISHIEKQT